jgi:hypothetical protein
LGAIDDEKRPAIDAKVARVLYEAADRVEEREVVLR